MRPKKTLAVEIGGRIREARERAGLSQAEVAERMRIRPQSYQAIESGRTPARARRAEIAQILGVSLDWLANGEAATLGRRVADRPSMADVIRRIEGMRSEVSSILGELDTMLVDLRRDHGIYGS